MRGGGYKPLFFNNFSAFHVYPESPSHLDFNVFDKDGFSRQQFPFQGVALCQLARLGVAYGNEFGHHVGAAWGLDGVDSIAAGGNGVATFIY